jgi:hypothetical protein
VPPVSPSAACRLALSFIASPFVGMILHRQRPIGCAYDYRLRTREHAKYAVIVFGLVHVGKSSPAICDGKLERRNSMVAKRPPVGLRPSRFGLVDVSRQARSILLDCRQRHVRNIAIGLRSATPAVCAVAATLAPVAHQVVRTSTRMPGGHCPHHTRNVPRLRKVGRSGSDLNLRSRCAASIWPLIWRCRSAFRHQLKQADSTVCVKGVSGPRYSQAQSALARNSAHASHCCQLR